MRRLSINLFSHVILIPLLPQSPAMYQVQMPHMTVSQSKPYRPGKGENNHCFSLFPPTCFSLSLLEAYYINLEAGKFTELAYYFFLIFSLGSYYIYGPLCIHDLDPYGYTTASFLFE